MKDTQKQAMGLMLNTTAFALVKQLLDPPKTCCAKHSAVPANGRDWNAVHVYMARMSETVIDTAGSLIEDARGDIENLLAGMQSKDGVFDIFAKSVTYMATVAILNAHAKLILNGCLETGNADLHYQRIIGICEELFNEQKAGHSSGKDAAAGPQDSRCGSVN
jgi:hypothetical protein